MKRRRPEPDGQNTPGRLRGSQGPVNVWPLVTSPAQPIQLLRFVGVSGRLLVTRDVQLVESTFILRSPRMAVVSPPHLSRSTSRLRRVMSASRLNLFGGWSSTGGTLALDAASVGEAIHDIASPLMIVSTTQGSRAGTK